MVLRAVLGDDDMLELLDELVDRGHAVRVEFVYVRGVDWDAYVS